MAESDSSAPRPHPARLVDLTGRSFGTLLVLEYAGGRGGGAAWHCQCQCGRRPIVTGNNLARGRTTTCGKSPCTRKGFKHGLRRVPEYNVWANMRARCQNPHLPRYPDYGGRGIAVCERWQKFENFFEDMGPRPSAQHMLERVDNDKGYSPDNCTWVTSIGQANNKRTSRLLTFNGKTQSVAMWARELHIKSGTICARIDRLGMTVDQALGATHDCRRAT